MDRRDFIKTLGIAGGAMLLAGTAGAAAAKTTAPRKNSGIDPLLSGICDIHIHCSPDTRPRCIDEFTLAEQAKQAGYRAVMYKSNDWSSHDRAYLIRQALPDFEVFGSLCMNRVHGDRVNAYAAEQAVKTSGRLCRCIWMPTYQSAFDMRKKGGGVPVLDAQGKVLPEVVKVMEICADADIIFATGHSSPDECVVLTAKAKEVGVKKAVVTHASQAPWKLSMDQAKACIDNGAYLEHSVLPYFKGPHAVIPGYREQPQVTMEEFASYIALAPDRQFISTDLGQALNPNPVDGMRTFITGLRKAGVKDDVLNAVTRKTPAMLLGLD